MYELLLYNKFYYVLEIRRDSHAKENYRYVSKTFWFIFLLNYMCNQAFSYFQFSQKDLFLATVDCLLVAITTLLLIMFSSNLSKVSAWLLIPYFYGLHLLHIYLGPFIPL